MSLPSVCVYMYMHVVCVRASMRATNNDQVDKCMYIYCDLRLHQYSRPGKMWQQKSYCYCDFLVVWLHDLIKIREMVVKFHNSTGTGQD